MGSQSVSLNFGREDWGIGGVRNFVNKDGFDLFQVVFALDYSTLVIMLNSIGVSDSHSDHKRPKNDSEISRISCRGFFSKIASILFMLSSLRMAQPLPSCSMASASVMVCFGQVEESK
jgi:hypothetical protein